MNWGPIGSKSRSKKRTLAAPQLASANMSRQCVCSAALETLSEAEIDAGAVSCERAARRTTPGGNQSSSSPCARE